MWCPTSTDSAAVPPPYTPPGKCIYCGATGVTLTDEHIIPDGLQGKLVLPAASCTKCQLETSKVELEALRTMLGDYRHAKGMTRKRKGRGPKVSRVEVEGPGGARVPKLVPTEDVPGILMLPQPPPPELLSGEPRPETMTFFLHYRRGNMEHAEEKHGPLSYPMTFSPAFPRMIAKIGHAFAYAELGVAKMETLKLFLPGLILEQGREDIWRYVGSNGRSRPDETTLQHQLDVGSLTLKGVEYLIARPHLFAKEYGPVYNVVVGARVFTGEPIAKPLRTGGPLFVPPSRPVSGI